MTAAPVTGYDGSALRTDHITAVLISQQCLAYASSVFSYHSASLLTNASNACAISLCNLFFKASSGKDTPALTDKNVEIAIASRDAG